MDITLSLDIDGEGVIRVVECSGETMTFTPHELGLVLTAMLKAVLSVEDGEGTVGVSLN